MDIIRTWRVHVAKENIQCLRSTLKSFIWRHEFLWHSCAKIIASIPNELEIKDTTDTQKSASYLDLHLEIDNGGRLKTKLDDNRDDFTFPIVNSPFTSSNIAAPPTYGVNNSQLICYYIACSQYNDFLDSGQNSAGCWLKSY